ncbi:hypothetical protein Bpfe_016614, partial [Biomphalaria pfeifferi]
FQSEDQANCYLIYNKDYTIKSEWMKYPGNYTRRVSNNYESVEVSIVLSL